MNCADVEHFFRHDANQIKSFSLLSLRLLYLCCGNSRGNSMREESYYRCIWRMKKKVGDNNEAAANNKAHDYFRC